MGMTKLAEISQVASFVLYVVITGYPMVKDGVDEVNLSSGFSLGLLAVIAISTAYLYYKGSRTTTLAGDGPSGNAAALPTPPSMEETVHGWLDRTGHAVQRLKPGPNQSFNFQCKTIHDFNFNVYDSKDEKNIIYILAGVVYPHLETVTEQNKRDRINQKVSVELLRSRIGYVFEQNWGHVIVIEAIPFDSSMTWAEFRKKIFDVQSATKLVHMTVDIETHPENEPITHL